MGEIKLLTMEEFFRLEGAYLGPVVISLDLCEEVRMVIKVIDGKKRKIGVVRHGKY